MRGEHFLLLAEREQLLPPAVLTQLRQILRAQKRPARGEAVARLLVDRGFLSVEQARRLVQEGSGGGSPLVPGSGSLAARPGQQTQAATDTASKASSPLAPSPSPPLPPSATAELILDPETLPSPAPAADQKESKSDTPTVKLTPPPKTGDYALQTDSDSGPPAHSGPTPPPVTWQPESWSAEGAASSEQASITELADSFSQWMDLPDDPTAADQSPSPLFAPQGIKIPTNLIYIGLATFGVLIILAGLIIMTKLRTG